MLQSFTISAVLLLSGVVNTTARLDNSNCYIQKEPKGIVGKMLQDTTKVKALIKKVITNYGNSENLTVANRQLQQYLTNQYYAYKLEAITLEYSDMTLEQFRKKWASKYDTKFVGNKCFFGMPQDHGKIEIKTCNFLNASVNASQFYHVVVHDIDWKIDYLMDVKIISQKDEILIDDVIEYN